MRQPIRPMLVTALALLLGCSGGGFAIDESVDVEVDVGIEASLEVSIEIGGETGGDDGSGRPDSGPDTPTETAETKDTAPIDSGTTETAPPDTGPDAPPDTTGPTGWSAAFTSGVAPTTQCTSWNAWRASLSATRVYTKITVSGTFDPGGVSCSGPQADTLCQALRKGVELAASVVCAGQAWGTTHCGAPATEIALSAHASDCTCTAGGYGVRPCGGFSDWGGVNSSCPAPSQTLSVVCE